MNLTYLFMLQIYLPNLLYLKKNHFQINQMKTQNKTVHIYQQSLEEIKVLVNSKWNKARFMYKNMARHLDQQRRPLKTFKLLFLAD